MRKLTSYLTALFLSVFLTLPALAADPYEKPDESWISINGTVVEPGHDTFTLDYGEGVVLVEMDDWDWYGEAHKLIDGDKVTVYGRIDDDLFEITSIEASSVYVEGLNTFFYANDADEEDVQFAVSSPIVLTQTVVQGTVTSIDGREFTIDTGNKKMTVDTIEMLYNPLDDKGYQKIKKGDYVRVSGDMTKTLFSDRELHADTVITLFKDKTKKNND